MAVKRLLYEKTVPLLRQRMKQNSFFFVPLTHFVHVYVKLHILKYIKFVETNIR